MHLLLLVQNVSYENERLRRRTCLLAALFLQVCVIIVYAALRINENLDHLCLAECERIKEQQQQQHHCSKITVNGTTTWRIISDCQ